MVNKRAFIGFIFCLTWVLSLQAQTGKTFQNPHGNLIKGLDCSDCHTQQSWKPIKDSLAFNHTKQTSFSLIGRHQNTSCTSCHVSLRFDEPKINNEDCAACHTDVHHGKLGENCEQCHNQHSFNDIQGIKIHARTNFPLTGSHAQIQCVNCHQNQKMGAFTTLETDCYSCHKKDYERTRTKALDHVSLGYPTECKQCHNSMGWAGAKFDHVSTSGYPLIGAHVSIRCQDCHEIPSMNLHHTPIGPNDCYSCHAQDYQHEHGGSNYPTTCLSCHNQTSWDGASFNHTSASGGFELIGAHKSIDCSSCHVIPSYQPKFAASSNNDCISCHNAEFQREHGGNYPTTCSTCHKQTTWEGATVNHTEISGGFELVGAHTSLDCSSCHVVPGYQNKFTATTQTDCISCHNADYQREHTSTGFSTTCTDCHKVDTWSGAKFTAHDSKHFPIYSGKHRNVWGTNCQTCHTNTSDYSIFFCTNCHEHNKSSMDSEHRGIRNYQYLSSACYSCHPRGTD
ncbi:hypothetical protein EP331_11840 [bacterium]|nr:MAG: hypothetical protein EP331_11840 [bacterium]